MAFELPPHALDRDVLDFFWKFSVFECALKREGFLKSDRYNNALPDWKKFSLAIKGQFAGISLPGFSEARHALQLLSPRRQVVSDDGSLGWSRVEKRDSDSDEWFTLELLKTARNNLFHGGKYPDGDIGDIARNREILRAALKILEGCYKLHAGVKRQVQRQIEEAA